MSMYLYGRPVPGFALGSVAPESHAKLDAMLVLMRANAANANTVSDYQGVGQYGADTAGPAIDDVGPAEATQPFTHDAWTINTKLAATSDIVEAKNLLDLMLTDYQKAIAASRKQQAPSGWRVFLIPAGILVLIGGVWYFSAR